MKKFYIISILFVWFIVLSGCNIWEKPTWQSSYYDWWTDDSNIIYWPVFNNFEWCKKWALNKKNNAYNNYVFCSKNCHDSLDWTPICEEVVRSWQPFLWSNTFYNYKE